jgi:mono/diheme cytochrome c family protein
MLHIMNTWLSVTILLSCAAPVIAGENGSLIYMTECATCHQKDATGIQDALPSLADSKIVDGELSGLVDLIARGKKGTAMRPYGVKLNEDQLVAVIEYLQATYSDKQDSEEKIRPLVNLFKKQAEQERAESEHTYQQCLDELNHITDPGKLFDKSYSCEDSNPQLAIYGYNLLIKKYPESDLVPKAIERLEEINPRDE